MSGDGLGGGFAPRLEVLPIDVIEIDAENPRMDFDPDTVEGLREALRTDGAYQQPPTVYPVGGGKFRVEHGNTRVFAAKGIVDQLAVLITAPPASSGVKLINQLSVNILQDSLNPVEVGKALARIQQAEELTVRGLARKLQEKGVIRSHTWVQMHLDMARLPLALQQMVAGGELSARHVWMLRSKPVDLQLDLARRARDEHWSLDRLAHEVGVRVEDNLESQGDDGLDAAPARPAASEVESVVGAPTTTGPAGLSSVAPARRGAPDPDHRNRMVASYWTLLPVQGDGLDVERQPAAKIRNRRWADKASAEDRQLALEAKRSGLSDDHAIRLVEQVKREAAAMPAAPVRDLLNALRAAEEHARDFRDCPGLAEFAALRMKNWMERLARPRPAGAVDLAPELATP